MLVKIMYIRAGLSSSRSHFCDMRGTHMVDEDKTFCGKFYGEMKQNLFGCSEQQYEHR